MQKGQQKHRDETYTQKENPAVTVSALSKNLINI